jgi:hypothetical protein
MRIRCALAVAAAAGIAGCGDDEDHANRERPPATINVTAAIADGRIHVSAREFGAGPIRLLVSNQTASAQQVTFETAGDASGVTQTSAPISPEGAATLEVDATEGEYELSTGDDEAGEAHAGDERAARGRIRPVAVKVGAPRPSAQNELLQP